MKTENLKKELKQLVKEWIIIRHIDFNIYNNNLDFEKWETLKFTEQHYELNDRVRDIDDTIYYLIKYGKENNISKLSKFVCAFNEEKEQFEKTYHSLIEFMESVYEYNEEFTNLMKEVRSELREELKLD